MRLSADQTRVIKQTARDLFGPEAQVWLFGSRVDDSLRGGDIDLLIQCPQPLEERKRQSLRMVARLQMALGDQPIDVLVLDPNTPRQPIHDRALKTGIPL
ncbi:nucleotidyltransferase domain-containing protein [Ectothiorhodospira variabilis]|uniref:nucleotidyltransferase domain-containing protein n=1 Tax=Ectothiorhodospira variabilis TaxID=505694 RepID=UPI001EFA8C1F|nr:nucleotidyltransferase domain-containing protein [Ectothiorhodospira variabilis]MCG5497554.1 nucleotidyltransferase domain-containing protein [Ectothiorhodospira variabilis]